MKGELIDLDLKVLHETERAYLVSNGQRKAWLPKSQCEDNGDGTFTMPVYLATEKELV